MPVDAAIPGPSGFSFDDGLRDRLAANLARHDRLELAHDDRHHAAVAVVVVDDDGPYDGPYAEAALLLTRRAARMRAHAGQWALPGGRVDDGENPVAAALRELHEELGLLLSATAMIGALDDYATRSGYVITPIVFWAGAGTQLQPNPTEVFSVHRVPFHELCRPDSPRFVSIAESEHPVVQVPIGNHLVHAPTGAILVQFRRVAIEGTSMRVAHYEQPVFAWR